MRNLRAGDRVVRCGPVGQFAIASARLMDAGRVLAVDRHESRLEMARAQGAEDIDFEAEIEEVAPDAHPDVELWRKYIPHLVEMEAAGGFDPSLVLTHHEPLCDAIAAFEAFDRRDAGWVKVALQPDGDRRGGEGRHAGGRRSRASRRQEAGVED